MKKVLIILTGFFLLSVFQVEAQEYSAIKYWNMEQDKTFINLVERQNKGEILTAEEQKSLDDYRMKLSEYFVRMPDSEKAIYYQNRASWKENQDNIHKVPKQETDVYSGERSMFTQYLITNGIFGAFYGASTAFIMGVEDGGVATGITLLTAGANVLIPVLSIKDRYVSYNSLSLNNHGKLIGAGQGLALGISIVGDNVDDGKLLLALSELSSIALGRVGYYLGKSKPWSEGRAKLYTYYGTLMPFEGLAIAAALKSEDPRIYGLSSLAFGAGGYFMADAISKRHDFTRGDITAIGTLASLHGMLGFGIMSDIGENSGSFHSGTILLPAFGALGASLAGHHWLKDVNLTNQQGRNVALATKIGRASCRERV